MPTNNQTDPEAIRNSLTREVTNDAATIAGQIFRGPQPDVAHVSNDQLDAHYRQAFTSGDRQFLMQEATRDPIQFLASMDRLGVTMPPGQELQNDQPLPRGAKPNVDIPKVHEAAQAQTYPSGDAVPPPAVPQLPMTASPVPPMTLPAVPAQPPLVAAPPPPLPPPA